MELGNLALLPVNTRIATKWPRSGNISSLLTVLYAAASSGVHVACCKNIRGKQKQRILQSQSICYRETDRGPASFPKRDSDPSFEGSWNRVATEC
jgi:hypothetical protein